MCAPGLYVLQIECFEDNPGILMYGNMCVVYTTGLWLLLASFFELPVSTTHSTIGGIVGMAMTYRGADCVVWYEEADLFPYLKVRTTNLKSGRPADRYSRAR